MNTEGAIPIICAAPGMPLSIGTTKAIEMDPNNMMFRTDLCYVLCRSGRDDEAKGILAEILDQSKKQHVPPIAIAGMHACLGEKESALDWLDKAYLQHSPYLASLRVERWFDKIRSDPRFVELLGKVGLNT